MSNREEKQSKIEVEDHNSDYVTREFLDLKLSNLKSDLRLLILASVALNQVLTNVSLPKSLTVAAITAALLAPVAKGAWVFFTKS